MFNRYSIRPIAVVAAVVMAAACGTGTPDGGTRAEGRTHEPAGSRFRPLRFAVIGDQGTGGAIQHEVAHRMCRWRRNQPFRLVFTTGDNVYPHGEPSRFDATFFDPYECLLTNGVRFHSTLGNHDDDTANGDPQVEEPAFGYKNGRRHYVIRKRGVRFVVANATDLRKRWLRRQTRAERGDRWTIVIFHYPVYSSGGYKTHGDWREWMPDLFVDRGVDMVLSGHDHLYSVTKRLRGIRYVVTGGGGAGLYACQPRTYADFCRSDYHFLYVRANRHRMWVRAVPRQGNPFHSFRTRGRDPG